MKLILASNSPRRKDLLLKGGFDFEIIASNYEETENYASPYETAECFAKSKALSVYDKLKNKTDVAVLGADTVVYNEGKILGKPVDRKEAEIMLKSLSGKTHEVISGYAVATTERIISGYVKTKVVFNALTNDEINRYLDSGLYKGKAGAYGIQDGYDLVKEYVGSFDNVVGLPTETLFPILTRLFSNE